MNYQDFEKIMSQPRMQRYLVACSNDGGKAIVLYRLNMELAQELFTIIGCFEVALRNAINKKCLQMLGSDWLKNAAAATGRFDNRDCAESQRIISEAITKLGNQYNHQKLLPELGLGFWRHLFAPHQYNALGKILLSIFPRKPKTKPKTPTSPAIQYNQVYFYKKLRFINDIRNRIAHHEPICFGVGNIKDTTYAQQNYNLILQLFQWMNINASQLLYGLDHVNEICSRINSL